MFAPATPVFLLQLREENYPGFTASLGYRVRCYLKIRERRRGGDKGRKRRKIGKKKTLRATRPWLKEVRLSLFSSQQCWALHEVMGRARKALRFIHG